MLRHVLAGPPKSGDAGEERTVPRGERCVAEQLPLLSGETEEECAAMCGDCFVADKLLFWSGVADEDRGQGEAGQDRGAPRAGRCTALFSGVDGQVCGVSPGDHCVANVLALLLALCRGPVLEAELLEAEPNP